MIVLRFVTGNSFVSAAIQRAEYGFWASHVEALMPDGTLLGAHIDGGVQARPRDYDKGQFTRELFVNIDAAPDVCDRFHAFLRRVDGRYLLSDVGSQNGTFVNDQRIQRQVLAPGDAIRLGQSVFTYRVPVAEQR